MSAFNVALALLGGLVLVVSLATGLLRSRSHLPSETMIALAFGVGIGPRGFDLFSLVEWAAPLVILEQVARLTVAFAVMSIALWLPERYFRRRARSMATLLGPGMVLMWLASTLVVALLVGVPFRVAMLVGAVVTPTDPVLASSIVTGGTAERNVPVRLRRFLSAEAGANDGLAYPFVFLPVLLLAHSPETALVEWVTVTLLWEVLGAVAMGLAVGAVVGWVERWSSQRERLEEPSVLTVTVALTFAVLGAVKLLGSDGLLAVFVAGLAYNRVADPEDEAEEQRIQEVFNRLFTYPIFVLFGTALPWSEWAALGWTGAAVVVGILLLRRLPMVVSVRPAVRPLDRPAATLFVGWFGPVGIAAVYYATVAARETGHDLVWPLASLVVVGSILAHGATAAPLTHWYGRLE
jgi:NhaP-type Na+/H+ or K+/H+ antiporter